MTRTYDTTFDERDDLAVNVIRGLAIDAVEKAKSGHPGTAMALAPLVHVLYSRILRHDPTDPAWPDRDRFVLSCGHASMLLYAPLYLAGYGLTLEDLRQFRQLGSATPGHPERLHTAGVEVTTGPLGQGVATSVGLALAERRLRAEFGTDLVDHYTFALCSDGDLMEGVSHEAASLAGHQRLGRLVWIYDDNKITIDGSTDLTFTDDTAARFRSYGWDVVELGEIANDLGALADALIAARSRDERPQLLVLRSHIGWPSPNMTDTPEAHGNPLGAAEVALTKPLLRLPVDEEFYAPQSCQELYRQHTAAGADSRRRWTERLGALDTDTAQRWAAFHSPAATVHAIGKSVMPSWSVGDKVATRVASGACVNALAAVLPGVISGGADLTGNTGTQLKGEQPLGADFPAARLAHYGIREHAMAAAMNGMAIHGGTTPIGGTFFVFSDYMRPAVRVAALSRAHVIHSWTHDSVGLGEDGPTHQPIEHLAAMRAMPGLRLIRPADANETAQAWELAIDHDGPVGLVLSRQNLPVLARTELPGQVARGGYVLVPEPTDKPDVVLVATGSEVHLCVDAAAELADHGVSARVVSLPSWDLFDEQSDEYRKDVLPPAVPTLSVEAGASFGWARFAQAHIAIDSFGTSAPSATALAHFGFTADNVVARATQLLEHAR